VDDSNRNNEDSLPLVGRLLQSADQEIASLLHATIGFHRQPVNGLTDE